MATRKARIGASNGGNPSQPDAASGKKVGRARASLSLKGRGLAYLAQRDHSRVELARKLLPHARAMVLAESAKAGELAASAASADEAGQSELSDGSDAQMTATERVSELLDWLQAHDYLSDTRFAESRTHARSAKFGNLRIRQELSQHGVSLPPEATQRLKETEFERARELHQRKFAGAPSTAAEYAKQSRFLAGRGFSGEAILQVMRRVGWAAAENSDADAEPA